jgi:chromosome segregation ATPase
MQTYESLRQQREAHLARADALRAEVDATQAAWDAATASWVATRDALKNARIAQHEAAGRFLHARQARERELQCAHDCEQRMNAFRR